jgi:hypothetical protein
MGYRAVFLNHIPEIKGIFGEFHRPGLLRSGKADTNQYTYNDCYTPHANGLNA